MKKLVLYYRTNWQHYISKTLVTAFQAVHVRVKIGGNAWERRSQARHFCILEFPGLKVCFFFRGNACSYTGNIVYPWERKFSNELVNVNLVKTWPDYKYKEPVAKVKGAHIFLQGARVYGIVEFNVPINTV